METQQISAARLRAAVACNAVLLVVECVALTVRVATTSFSDAFMYYTNCSNLFAAIAALVCLVCEVRLLRGTRSGGVPLSARWFKFAASCVQLMTFFVVMVVLGPMMENAGMPGYWYLLTNGVMPVTHLVGPGLTIVSFMLFESLPVPTMRQTIAGLIPTLVYASVAYPCNMLGVWDGPYPFFRVLYMTPVESVLWFFALLALSFMLCCLVRLLARLATRRRA